MRVVRTIELLNAGEEITIESATSGVAYLNIKKGDKTMCGTLDSSQITELIYALECVKEDLDR